MWLLWIRFGLRSCRNHQVITGLNCVDSHLKKVEIRNCGKYLLVHTTATRSNNVSRLSTFFAVGFIYGHWALLETITNLTMDVISLFVVSNKVFMVPPSPLVTPLILVDSPHQTVASVGLLGHLYAISIFKRTNCRTQITIVFVSLVFCSLLSFYKQY